MKTVWMFSGQGAQYPGMGRDFYDNFAVCRRTFEEASEVLGMDMAKLCFEENERLGLTEYCQPALLTVGFSAARALAEEGFRADIMMGLSLGEYTALTAAGALTFFDALRLVRIRGKLMAEKGKPGLMSAAMGLEALKVEELCGKALESGEGYAACANYNMPLQTVIAGEEKAVIRCEELIRGAGGKVIRLKVQGPFHTKLMEDAADSFREQLEPVKFSQPERQVICNLTADLFDMNSAAETLMRQMVSPVRWVESVEKAVRLGADTFVELGAGKTLCSFVKKINKEVEALPIETVAQLRGLVAREKRLRSGDGGLL